MERNYESTWIETANGERVRTEGVVTVRMIIEGAEMKVTCVLLGRVLNGVDVILGMDIIGMFPKVTITYGRIDLRGRREGNGVGEGVSGAALETTRNEIRATQDREAEEATKCLKVDDVDFEAEFSNGKWNVKWKWVNGPPRLDNRVGEYAIKADVRKRYNDEVGRWIERGWLVPAGDIPNGGVLPLMAVVQANKDKVRPVLDYRELNKHVLSHTRDAAVCGEKLREWRKMPKSCSMLDLKDAYLQLEVDESLRRFQQVVHRGKRYVLTRLGFGLSSAPRIMSRVLEVVLKKDETIYRATSSYIDDIIVNEDIIDVEHVRGHLAKFGLTSKPAVKLKEAKALGLQLAECDDGRISWKRGSAWTDEEVTTKRHVFSWCGKIVSHYPVAGWLRVASSFLKRMCRGEWDEPVDDCVREVYQEICTKLKENDPVGGCWNVACDEDVRIWCDASSIAIGTAIEVGGFIIEDGAWLRREQYEHINLAELESVVKGVNIALKWGFTRFTIVSDSATVVGWMKTVVNKESRTKVRGTSEMLVRRRLDLLEKLEKEYGLFLKIQWVPSGQNKADRLTRINKKWLDREQIQISAVSLSEGTTNAARVHR